MTTTKDVRELQNLHLATLSPITIPKSGG